MARARLSYVGGGSNIYFTTREASHIGDVRDENRECRYTAIRRTAQGLGSVAEGWNDRLSDFKPERWERELPIGPSVRSP